VVFKLDVSCHADAQVEVNAGHLIQTQGDRNIIPAIPPDDENQVVIMKLARGQELKLEAVATMVCCLLELFGPVWLTSHSL
jgi:hypothetical protein